MAAKFILPAIALAGSVVAQCSGPSIEITTSADAAAIASCETYDGDVIITMEATGTVQLNGVQQITGSLTCNNATQLTAITSDQLNSIGGTFDLQGLTILSTLQFDSLEEVNHINWIALPALQALNFGRGVARANTVYISNTDLNNIGGIELTQVGSMDLNNNRYLNTINVNDLTNVTQFLSFSANGKNLEIQFPNLQGAANLTFRNCSSIEMPSLADVGGSMGFYSNSFQTFSAPNLTELTRGSLAFVDSPELTSLDFPSLTLIGGGFLLANNSKLEVLDGFPVLQTIGGAIDFAGSFSSVSMPSLRDVRGGSNVQTSSTNSSLCDAFNAAAQNDVIKGTNVCKTGQANPGNNGTNGGSGSGGSGHGNAASSFLPAITTTGLIAIVGAFLFI